jgi:serine/threonine protein kinase
MGVVYRATDLRLHQLRAVKVLPGTDPAMMARFRREARAMAAAQHHSLATLHGLETWRGAPMLVMEFLEGGTLADRIRRGPVTVGETIALGINLASGLAVLHDSGILHRDIKPSNIGFTGAGMPKLLDFGLAKFAPQTASDAADQSTQSTYASTGLHGLRGTPAYLSPQVLSGSPPSVDDDLWSLAITLLEALTGTNPFRAATVAATIARVLTDAPRLGEAAARLPEPARGLFEDLLGPLGRRPRSASQLAERLSRCA